MKPLEGGCLCGAVRYRLGPGPRAASICHCATCRRAVGAQSVAWVTVAAEAFRWTAGAAAVFDPSPGVERMHCPLCGASLAYRAEPATIDVTLASLDDPEAVSPTRELWLSHRLSWALRSPNLPGSPDRGAG